VPFNTGDETVPRYYHLYTFDEFGKALEEAGYEVLRLGPEASFSDRQGKSPRNICALVKKRHNSVPISYCAGKSYRLESI